MRIVTARRISQVFFVTLFLWFCVVATLGERWWQLRGWPINWLLELDPLVALATALTTGAVYAGLLWALLTVVLTIVLGRFFCGWVCPFGAMHQFVGWLGRRRRKAAQKTAVNAFHRGQAIKYYLLVFLLTAGAGGLLSRVLAAPSRATAVSALVAAGLAVAVAVLAVLKIFDRPGRAVAVTLTLTGLWLAVGLWLPLDRAVAASLQTGLLDPIPLVYRSINLVVAPLLDSGVHQLAAGTRTYEGTFLIGGIFVAALLLNLWRPRFYCRYVCPLGALTGLLGRFAWWRVAKRQATCRDCGLCEHHCEGACRPSGELRHAECVLCLNCLDGCPDDEITFRPQKSAAGEITSPDLTRRGLTVSLISAVTAVPMLRLSGLLGHNYAPRLVRPPGALPEAAFLDRCTKCGQCLRVCPTNVLQPAGLQAGLEGLWTPVLNFRVGTSGCQLICVACGHVCPTAAIRPLSLDEKLGRGKYAAAGPIRIGTAFVDRGRCLPWAMDRPCIVCQENCPVSPKAIFTRVEYQTIRDGRRRVIEADGRTARVSGPPLTAGALATGDYFVSLPGGGGRRRIKANRADSVTSAKPWTAPPRPGTAIEIQVRLQRPYVDVRACIGCGTCEHECPVSGLRAIRVTAENESRRRGRTFL
ncbi:MAG: 4Fe-4S binding protein [Proteobacteria bacterium]|nr:4Fe-4S binding protein [Pseudomonadota bacterium]